MLPDVGADEANPSPHTQRVSVGSQKMSVIPQGSELTMVCGGVEGHASRPKVGIPRVQTRPLAQWQSEAAAEASTFDSCMAISRYQARPAHLKFTAVSVSGVHEMSDHAVSIMADGLMALMVAGMVT